jgi:hypothetical protein
MVLRVFAALAIFAAAFFAFSPSASAEALDCCGPCCTHTAEAQPLQEDLSCCELVNAGCCSNVYAAHNCCIYGFIAAEPPIFFSDSLNPKIIPNILLRPPQA